jgi:HK97 family phage major capsid protein
MMSQKEAAELRRQKTDLEQQRLELKRKCEQHRSAMNTDELTTNTEQLRSLGDKIDEINEKLTDAPQDSTPKGGVRNMRADINQENFRSSDHYRDAFFRSFMSGKVAESDNEVMAFGKRAITDMNGLSVTSGAEYLVPQTTLSQIKAIITKYGAIYAKVTKYNFNGDVTIPIGTAGTPTNESDGTDTLTFTFTEVAINQQAVVATVSVKNLLMKNSIAGLEAYLAMEIGKYVGLQIENYLVNGSLSTSKFEGIVTAITAAPSAAETYDEVDWDLINDVQAAVESPYGDNGTWMMRRATFFSKFRTATDAEGRPLVVTSGGSGSSTYTLDGRPVIFSTQIAANAFIFGDLDQYIVNETQEFIIEADASAGFAADKTVWRGKVYAGGRPLFAKTAFVYYTYTGE